MNNHQEMLRQAIEDAKQEAMTGHLMNPPAVYHPAPALAPQVVYVPTPYQPGVGISGSWPAAGPSGPMAGPAPLPPRDPWPARLLCGGIGVGAAGVGVGFLLQQVAAATTGLGFLAAILALVWLLKGSSGGRSGSVTVKVNNHNRNR